MITPGKDFKFRDDKYSPEKGETVPIEILTKPYDGIIYRYEKVAIKEQEDGQALLQFSYELIETGNHVETTLRKDPKFQEHLGILLNSLILEAIDANQGQDNSADRESDIEESDEKRGILS